MTTPTDEGPQPTDAVDVSAPRRRTSRLNQALAWVGIVAGGLFVVASIFFSGYFLSWSIGGSHYAATSRMDCCDQMKSGDQMAPGHMMPGMTTGPGGMMGPQSPTAAPPSPPRP
ncbi:hypothetical protein [Mycobacterium sp. pR1184]|uniref:hypothetical protein n=1 Tax=Mycobacterium sp. pR1184 TaxID=3238981 RepID=UPI00351B8FE2